MTRTLSWIALTSLAFGSAAKAQDTVPPTTWTLSSLYSYSALKDDRGGDRGDWNEGAIELLGRLSPALTLGAHVDIRDRSNGTDELYGLLSSYQLTPRFEIHEMARFSPSPNFSARQTYSGGVEWRAFTPVSFLVDYDWLDFAEGSIHQVKPALTLWFNEVTFLTARYTYGRAYDDHSFTAYSVRLTVGLPRDASLGLAWAHGVDPEKDPDAGVLLTMANVYDVTVRMPLMQRLDVIVGGEYEDRHRLYTRRMATVGLSVKF